MKSRALHYTIGFVALVTLLILLFTEQPWGIPMGVAMSLTTMVTIFQASRSDPFNVRWITAAVFSWVTLFIPVLVPFTSVVKYAVWFGFTAMQVHLLIWTLHTRRQYIVNFQNGFALMLSLVFAGILAGMIYTKVAQLWLPTSLAFYMTVLLYRLLRDADKKAKIKKGEQTV